MRFENMKMVEVSDKNIVTYTPQFLRETVFNKLVRIAGNAPAPLVLYEGFRPIEKQIAMFNGFKASHPGMTDEEVNKFIAIPGRAVHVTGGAVDITLLGYDMGTEYLCFDGRQATAYYDGIDEAIAENRRLLCDLAAGEDFVNFYNEWWHFEYGTSLWCRKYGKEPLFDAVKEIRNE